MVTRSLEGLPTKTKEAPSPHENWRCWTPSQYFNVSGQINPKNPCQMSPDREAKKKTTNKPKLVFVTAAHRKNNYKFVISNGNLV